ncbi:hypothetical protein NMY22_g17207 [Coprinellus aureogranulatus]|nr:hypothetical protein NMY22_g17207 [Coprinellus aureogranulatus]
MPEANSLLFNLMQFRLLVSSGMNGDSDWEGREEGIKRKGQRPSGRMEPRGAEDAVGEKILITETSGKGDGERRKTRGKHTQIPRFRAMDRM